MKRLALALFLFSIGSVAYADEPLLLNHRIVGVDSIGGKTQVYVEFTIRNNSAHNLREIQFFPEGIEFSNSKSRSTFYISHLQVKGFTTILWTGISNLSPQYFLQDTPLFFFMEAIHQNDQPFQTPVISNSEGV
ncbi:MAG: hypothetical protein OEZ43_10290 [Gammaproteobacteria bacterium]|nr:hypothetical protein [Gammaproteobacteria bacterium]